MLHTLYSTHLYYTLYSRLIGFMEFMVNQMSTTHVIDLIDCIYLSSMYRRQVIYWAKGSVQCALV